MFWVALTIFFDPGGYIGFYFNRDQLGGLQITDLTFVLLFIPLASPQLKMTNFFKQGNNKWLIVYSILFALLYHILIYGYIAPGGVIKKFTGLLQYQRLTIWGFMAMIPAYIFFKRSSHLFFKISIATSVTVMVIFIITLLTGLDLIPFAEIERSRGSGIMRIGLLSYGFADWLMVVMFAISFFNVKIPNRRIIYFVGLSVVFCIILALTRRSMLNVIFYVLTAYVLHQNMVNKPIVNLNRFGKVIIGFCIILLVVFIFKPSYIAYTLDSFSDIISIIETGEDTKGEVDARLDSDIPQHLARFRSSPIFGTGWDENWYSNLTEEGGLSANDTPLTAALGMFGALGLLLFLPFYIKVYSILYKTYYIFKKGYLNGFAHANGIVFGFGLFILIIFITRYTLNFMSYFDVLIVGKTRVYQMVLLGFLLASADIVSEYNFRKSETLSTT